ncbi:hypothetical protein K438DRAFT_1838525 [Mycena galopus ATCC 62051]|nr:hypothetical protein K438DRAFT_1838525 [Mycena galopus ATCC 62051]
MSSPIAFIIGAGKNIGGHTAAALKAKGYRVALGSRKPVVDEVKKDGYFAVPVDAGNPESVKAAFAEVNKELGPPSVVIFNAAVLVSPPVPEDPLTLSLEAFKQHTDFGLSVYVAAQEAVLGFRSETNKDALKTFIKVLKWRLIEILSRAYSKDGFRFHFASLVGEDGGVVQPISDFFTSGPQHAQVYLDLITRKDQADWDYRFTLDGKQWTN